MPLADLLLTGRDAAIDPIIQRAGQDNGKTDHASEGVALRIA